MLSRLLVVNPGFTRWKKDNVYGFLAVHLTAALAVFPWFFSWTGVVLLAVGLFVFGILGINLCFHRLLTHRGLACPRWLERSLAFLGTCSLQDSPPHWVAVHRKHHHHSDDDRDPHSPLVSFFWAHIGWLLVRMENMDRRTLIARYAKDIMRDPFYAWLERHHTWLKIALVSWIAYFIAGFAFVICSGGTLSAATQFGLSLFVWGAVLRTVMVWHFTWSINSVTHVWGYRNYDTHDVSRNNALIALLTSGEGWHNNHHAEPRSARHGHMWWEIDVTWMIIRLLMSMGLVTDVVLAPVVLAENLSNSTRRAGPERLDLVEPEESAAPLSDGATAGRRPLAPSARHK
jgi:fatty-acid desaturase